MLKVAICDDDEKVLGQLGEAVGKILFARDEYEISYFRSGEEIRESVEQKLFSSQLLLLDIHMHPWDGMQTAAWLRKRCVDVDIIFVTVSQEHVYEGYTYKAFAYLLKPLSMERLGNELNRYLDEIAQGGECLNISVRGYERKVAVGRILYAESDKRKIRLHLPEETLEFYGKMDELAGILEKHGFLRCHQSYLVNTSHIRGIGRSGIEMEGMKIPISRKYWEILRGK